MPSTNVFRAAFAIAFCAMTLVQNTAIALNPQPLPPKALAKLRDLSRLRLSPLNPQPLPPNPPPDRLNEMLRFSRGHLMRQAAPELVYALYKQPAFNTGNPAFDIFGRKALNPQPLPPKAMYNALNPQPLPPKALYNALNPQPLPPRW